MIFSLAAALRGSSFSLAGGMRSKSKSAALPRQPIVHFPDDDSDMDSESNCDKEDKKLDIEELTAEHEPKKCEDPPIHQIPIKLSDGRLVTASFTHLDDPVIPPWSVFYQQGAPVNNGVNININRDEKKSDPQCENDSRNRDQARADESNVDHLWSELQSLGKLPASPFPSR